MPRNDHPTPDLVPLPDLSRRPDAKRTVRRAVILLVGLAIGLFGMCYTGWLIYSGRLPK